MGRTMIIMDLTGALLYVRQFFTDNKQILKHLYQTRQWGEFGERLGDPAVQVAGGSGGVWPAGAPARAGGRDTGTDIGGQAAGAARRAAAACQPGGGRGRAGRGGVGRQLARVRAGNAAELR